MKSIKSNNINLYKLSIITLIILLIHFQLQEQIYIIYEGKLNYFFIHIMVLTVLFVYILYTIQVFLPLYLLLILILFGELFLYFKSLHGTDNIIFQLDELLLIKRTITDLDLLNLLLIKDKNIPLSDAIKIIINLDSKTEDILNKAYEEYLKNKPPIPRKRSKFEIVVSMLLNSYRR